MQNFATLATFFLQRNFCTDVPSGNNTVSPPPLCLQHIPHYCGSCWAQGTVSALADRFAIADLAAHANLALSPQVVLNCRAGGSCHGGDPTEVYHFAKDHGVG